MSPVKVKCCKHCGNAMHSQEYRYPKTRNGVRQEVLTAVFLCPRCDSAEVPLRLR